MGTCMTEFKILYEDAEFGFCILAHDYTDAKTSDPHDHAHSWAIYGQARGEMKPLSEFRFGQAAPEGFVFALKAPQRVTHVKRLAGAVDAELAGADQTGAHKVGTEALDLLRRVNRHGRERGIELTIVGPKAAVEDMALDGSVLGLRHQFEDDIAIGPQLFHQPGFVWLAEDLREVEQPLGGEVRGAPPPGEAAQAWRGHQVTAGIIVGLLGSATC